MSDSAPKRALIVDDSRSARVILSRMLESYALAVETCESAEQALEFLATHRPDVIFMDHLMPGMDGFQAIQAIKNNPATATIPVMMYTSQEGELYLSQARALGAVGVLPKTVKQADVSRVLYQLGLLTDRRAGPTVVSQVAAQPATVEIDEPDNSSTAPPAASRPAGELESALRKVLAPLLKEQSAELRRFVLASLDTLAQRIGDKRSSESRVHESQAPASPPEYQSEISTEPAKRAGRWPLAVAATLLALLPTAVLAVLYVRTLDTLDELTRSNAQLAVMLEEQQLRLAEPPAASTTQATATLASIDAMAPSAVVLDSELVPYGETPLSGSRLERLQEMVENLRAGDFRGRIRIATYVGEFCLTGNGIEGYSMAANDLPIARCDLVGNPFDDSLSPSQRQSLAFANLLSSLRQELGDSLSIEVQHEGRLPAIAYPDGEQRSRTTAGEWNHIAAQNNRVEFVAEAGIEAD